MTLSKEQIEEWREMLIDPSPWASEVERVRAINALCDMALRSLSPAVAEGCVVVPNCEHPDCLQMNRPATHRTPGIGNLCADHALIAMAAGSPTEKISAAPLTAAGWVSVKDRLPTANVEVWAWVKYRFGRVNGAETWLNEDGTWELSDDQRKVTHWMPLPPPPGEKG